MGLWQVEQGFSSFFAKFLAYIFDDFSPLVRSTIHIEKIIKYAKKKLAKIEEKPSSTCCKPIFRLNTGTRKSDFGYPIRHYSV